MSYVVLLLSVGVTIYALVDCWNSTDDEVRGLPRLAWLLVVLLFPLVGATAYLIYGRERQQPIGPGQPRVVAPDDDPEFLRQLDVQRRRAAAEEKRRRDQQLRRERKERERQERQQRKEHKGDPDGAGPEAPEGGHSGRPAS